MSHNAWLSHFEGQLKGLKEQHRLSGSSLSLIAYALEQQSLPTEQYLTWAMEHFGLPQLQNRFFTESSHAVKTFLKWKTQSKAWNSEFYPVGEWDGHLIIACLYPPENFPQDLSVTATPIFALASFEALQNFWNQHGVVNHNDMATVATPVSGAEFSADDLDISSQPTRVQSSPDDLLEFNDDFLSDSKSSTTNTSEVAAEESSIPEGLSDSFGADLKKKSKESPLESLDNKFDDKFTVTQLEKTQTLVVADTAAPKAATLPPVPNQETLLSEKTIGESSINQVASPTLTSSAIVSFPKSKPTKPPVAPGQVMLEKWKKKYGPQVAELSQETLKQMKSHFEKSMILSLDENETQLVAFIWDTDFQPVDATKKIPLGTPSIFNIVTNTQKPFHGYVSINDVNEKFFEDWNQGTIPDHVTITPIFMQEKIIGLLVGLGEKSAYNKMSLHLCEKLSAEFGERLAALKAA